MKRYLIKYSRFLQLEKHQIKIKFVLIGFWNTVFAYAIFCLLDSVFSDLFITRQVAYMSAMATCYIISIINAFVFHKLITFQSNVITLSVVIPELLRFCLTSVFTLVLSLILLPFFVEILGYTPKIAAAFSIFICIVISYLGHSRFSFAKS